MKKALIAAMAAVILLTACGAEEKKINGVTYATYGLFNKDENKNPNVQYEISGWSIVWSIIFVETIIAPIYFIGFDLYQPVAMKDPNLGPGVIKKD